MSEEQTPSPSDPSQLPFEPYEGLMFGRKMSARDIRTVAQPLGKGALPSSYMVRDVHGAVFYIRRQPDGSWMEA